LLHRIAVGQPLDIARLCGKGGHVGGMIRSGVFVVSEFKPIFADALQEDVEIIDMIPSRTPGCPSA